MAFPDEIQHSAPNHPAQIMMHVPLPVVILIESVPVVISTERRNGDISKEMSRLPPASRHDTGLSSPIFLPLILAEVPFQGLG